MYHRLLTLLLCALLTGCTGGGEAGGSSAAPTATATAPVQGTVTAIGLSDSGVTVDGQAASTDPSTAVYVGGDIIYYQDGTDQTYGEGEEGEKHTAQEAAAHTLVTITQPGTYRLSGTLAKGQIAVDLGPAAKDDPAAVVTLILDNANVTCTVAPALIFYHVYECDRDFVAYGKGENAGYQPLATVDTTAAGANVVLAAGTQNTFTGSHVARIYQPGTTENLHRYDGAFYSCMSMNIFGDNGDDTGVLNIVADNEGLDSELHLTLNGGAIHIDSQDDGINTNEDNVSVTTVNGGSLTVNAGQGAEGDGIDSNGYLVINGGSVVTMSNDRSADGGIDADRDILINGGTLAAFGTRNDAVSRDSAQAFLEFYLAAPLSAGSVVELKDGEGNLLWSGTAQRAYQSVTLSLPGLSAEGSYQLYADGQLQENSGQGRGFGPEGGRPGDGGTPPQPPEGFEPGNMEGERPQPPEGFEPGQFEGERPQGGRGGHGPAPAGEERGADAS